MLTALTNLDTSPWLNESFEELLLFSVIFTQPQKCCVMVSMLTLNVVDPWVLARLVKPKIIKLVRMQH